MTNRAGAYAILLAVPAAAGLALLLPDFISSLRADPRGVVIWFGLLATAGVLTYVKLRGGGAVIGTAVVNFGIIIIYGGAVAAWLGAIEMMILAAILRFNALRLVFNVSQMALSLAAAGLVFKLAGGGAVGFAPGMKSLGVSWIPPVMLCHATYFLTNTGLVAVWTSLRQRCPVLAAWKGSYLWMIPQSLAAPVVGVALAFAYARFSLLAVAILFAWLVYYARSSKTNLEMLTSQRQTVAALAATVDASTPFMGGESERVAALAVELGRRTGMAGSHLRHLEYAALLHDIGYLGLAKRVVGKETCLTPEEWSCVRRHAEVGSSIIGQVRALRKASDIVLAHHERPDGRGYPGGKSGGQIPKAAAILKVADAFVAMTTARPYRPAMSVDEAMRRIEAGRNTQFDGDAVAALVDLYTDALLGRYSVGQDSAAA